MTFPQRRLSSQGRSSDCEIEDSRNLYLLLSARNLTSRVNYQVENAKVLRNLTKIVALLFLIGFGVAGAGVGLGGLAWAASPEARKPVLVELFTSEGCSSCPPADALLQAIDREQNIPGAQVIVLSEHVDYWDHDGWRDPFSSAAMTARQEAYAARFTQDSAYTPEAVIDGAKGLVGSDRRGLTSAVEQAAQRPKEEIAITGASVSGNAVAANVMIGALSRADLYAVLADDHDESSVSSGENSGRRLTHVAVARVIKRVGSLNNGFSGQVRLAQPKDSEGRKMRLIIFAQEQGTGRILGVGEAIVRPAGGETQQQTQSS
jgi:hypothetical protein